jgi:hypothetical protein
MPPSEFNVVNETGTCKFAVELGLIQLTRLAFSEAARILRDIFVEIGFKLPLQ